MLEGIFNTKEIFPDNTGCFVSFFFNFFLTQLWEQNAADSETEDPYIDRMQHKWVQVSSTASLNKLSISFSSSLTKNIFLLFLGINFRLLVA